MSFGVAEIGVANYLPAAQNESAAGHYNYAKSKDRDLK
jgi:hypothetical protein